MNILIFCNAFFPKQDGIIYRIQSFLDYVEDKKEFNVVLVTPNPNTYEKYKRFKIYKVNGDVIPKFLNIHERKDIFQTDMFYGKEVFDKLHNIIEKNNIDVIHCYHGDFSLNILNLLSQVFNIPTIYSWHTDMIHYNDVYMKEKNLNIFFQNYMTYLIKFFLKLSGIHNCQQVLTVSKDSKRRLKNYFPKIEDIKLFPIVIDTRIFYPINDIPKNEVFTALFVGRIDPEKNLDELLEYINDINDIKINIIGDGTYREYLEKKYKSDKIIFVGKLKRNELNYYYNQADLFINPSKTETLGFTTLEALATKTPVIAYKSGGTLDIITHKENGLLYESKNEFLENIKIVKEETELTDKLKNNGLKFCLKHDVPNQCKFLLNIYKDKINMMKADNINHIIDVKKNIFKLLNLIFYICTLIVLKIFSPIKEIISL